MLQALSPDHRLLLVKFVCAFAWTDLEITDSERRFVERLVDKLGLGPEERSQVDAWLHVAPAPSEVDAAAVPREHKQLFIDAARAVMYADGAVDPEEREQLERLKRALET